MTHTVLRDDGKIDVAALEKSIADGALSVDGVCRYGGGLLRWIGIGGAPRARAWLDRRGRVHLRVGIAVQFGYDLRDLANRAQTTLAEQAARLTQRDVAPVKVKIVRIVAAKSRIRETLTALPKP